MGTTFVGALLLGSQAHLAALGDSRAYLVSGELVCPLTYDQNLKSLLLRLHMLGRQVDLSEPGHALVGFLGHFAPDGTPSLPPLFQRTLSLLPGEWLILCSDGLTDYAAPSERELAELLRIETSKTGDENLAMDLARTLVAAANRGGGGDNITVLVITLSRKAQTAARGIGASEDTTKA
jgi:protein phosphatase